MSRILITGSRGFIAGALLSELRRWRPHARVICLDHVPASGHITCDMRDAAALRHVVRSVKPTMVFHLAGSRRPLPWSELWDTHVLSTINLMEALRELPRPPRVLIAGSSAEYGLPGHNPVAEKTETCPLNPYGATKLCQTLAALSFLHEGVPVVVVRLFNIMGPATPVALAPGAFAEQIARIERDLQPPVLRVGNLNFRRDYVDVRDAVRGMIAALEHGLPGEIYNVCSGMSRPMRGILSGLMRGNLQNIRILKNPLLQRRAEVPDLVGSRGKLAVATGWRPRISLEQSLRDTLQWHRDRIKAKNTAVLR